MNRVLLPEGWPRPKGYANGVEATGRMVFVAAKNTGTRPRLASPYGADNPVKFALRD